MEVWGLSLSSLAIRKSKPRCFLLVVHSFHLGLQAKGIIEDQVMDNLSPR